MYISVYFSERQLREGFKKWSDAHQSEINKDVSAGEGYGVVATDPNVDNRVMTSPERPHCPWLVPGVGRL
jgi:hypothetical protein